MGRRQQPKAGHLQISLGGPDMTPTGRVGLAALAITLERLKSARVRLPQGCGWTADDQSVALHWGEEGPASLLRLIFKRGLSIGADGLPDFPAWRNRLGGQRSAEVRVRCNEALLNIYLQHNQVRSIGERRYLVTEATSPPRGYVPLRSFKHQQEWQTLVKHIPSDKHVRINGAFVLGAVEKHPGKGYSRMEVTPVPKDREVRCGAMKDHRGHSSTGRQP